MDNGANEAQMITRVILGGSVFILKISGAATMQLARFLSKAANGELSSSGMVNLKTMLKSGKRLKVYTIKGNENFRRFAIGANEYGIKYAVIKRSAEDKKDELYELMVYEDDASKINRVIEKYDLLSLQDTDGTVEQTEENAGNTEADTETMEIEDIRGLLAKMMESDTAEGASDSAPFYQVSESENLSGSRSEDSADDYVETLAGQKLSLEEFARAETEEGAYFDDLTVKRVPGVPSEERMSVKAEIKQVSETLDTQNTVGNNPGLLAQMMMPDDADEKDKLKYGIGIIQEAIGTAFANVVNQTGGEVTDAGTGN